MDRFWRFAQAVAGHISRSAKETHTATTVLGKHRREEESDSAQEGASDSEESNAGATSPSAAPKPVSKSDDIGKQHILSGSPM